MIRKYVVVDGSNIATEGRSTPSLHQLDEAVRAFMNEHPTEVITVIVDATFGHRIDESERPDFEAAVNAGELITAPAGTIGRGDAFVLQVADKADASVLSNDSFQEFHGQYDWLFDEGRLVGGKPVPGVGWVFLLRSPVRGPVSRKAVKDAKAPKDGPKKKVKKTDRADAARSGKKDKGKTRVKKKAGEREGGAPSSTDGAGSSRTRSRKPDEPLNEPLPFIEFVAAHPVGSTIEAEVERFSSHGAYVRADAVRCYLPLKLMGDPAPRSAKDALTIGERRLFAVHAIDAPRRGVDVALVAEKPAIATVSADSNEVQKERKPANGARKRASRTSRTTDAPAQKSRETRASAKTASEEESAKTHTSAPEVATTTHADQLAEEAPVTPAKKAAARKAAKKTAAKRTARKAAKRSPARKKKAAAKRPARKSTAKRATKKRATKKRAAKKSTAKRATKKRATKKRATTKRATKKAAKRSPARKKKAAAKRPAKKRATKKRAAKRAPAKKRATKRRARRR